MAGGDYACIKITDNGCGIDESDIEHIFEPFFTTKEVGQGTGLGLAMSYGAIQSHNGIIRVESHPGQGTTFIIYLPLIEFARTVMPKQSAQDFVKGQGETIMLVDDNRKIVDTGCAVLESLGYKVITAHDGIEAVEKYRSHRDDIALSILDVIMPRMGGVNAAQSILAMNPHGCASTCRIVTTQLRDVFKG